MLNSSNRIGIFSFVIRNSRYMKYSIPSRYVSYKTVFQQKGWNDAKREHTTIKHQYFNPSKKKYRLFKNLTILEGEKYIIYNTNGKHEIISGPTSKYIVNQFYNKMESIIAKPDQYVIITNKNGIVEHKEGPNTFYLHPLHHHNIKLEDKLKLTTGEAIVVYSSNEQGDVTKKVIHGPCTYYPNANQWLHTFSWSDKSGKVEFTKLQKVNTVSYSLEGLRTKCNATLYSLDISLSFKIDDIELMLEKTTSPLNEFGSAVSADLLHFVGNYSLVDFKNYTNELNSLDKFSITKKRAKQLGLSLENADFCGYKVNNSIQQLLDEEIHASISNRIKNQQQEQIQKSLDFELQRKIERQEKEINLSNIKTENEIKLQAKREYELQNIKIKHNTLVNEQKLEYLNKLKSLGVDLTKVLESENQINNIFSIEGKQQNKKE